MQKRIQVIEKKYRAKSIQGKRDRERLKKIKDLTKPINQILKNIK